MMRLLSVAWMEFLPYWAAVMATGVAIGLFRDLPEACSHIRMSGDIEPDPAVQPVYALIKKRYAMLYPSLKEAFHTRA